ncbi:tripartite motif-containing protein 16-like [Megalobrama amblycephala]|uniref:tripartite motif-containing protein 16-like n=1 Tax=Megalobrama amblycephala TaxID=75352 RepID=UPI0020141FE6|nr:tripartite motif-containing protein 16-like [Megalobrama amblycephala]
MAEARFSQDEFMCPVCLDLLKDPVTIHCGHSYCKICITGCWDQEDEKRVYSCPQCRQTFSPRPVLAKNTILAEMVEKLKKTKLPADCYAGAGDVQCDVCTGRKHKAVKSCLVCLESYCQTHFDRHEEFHSRKPHKVTEATGRLQEMICPKHDKILDVFCRTDQKCICVLCTMDEHKNHDTVSAAAQRTEKQHQLKEMQRSFQQRIQQREKDLQQLREAVESHKRSAQTAVEDSERIFTELIRSIERSRSEATQRIRDQEKTAVSRAEGRLERLEQEINDLRRRDAELEQLSHTQDHIHFLQSFQSLSAPPESTDVNDDPFSSLSSFDVVRESVLQLRDKLEDFCKEELKKISDRVTFTNIVPRTRNDFLQYSHQLNLDLNTVNENLRLSERNRVITFTGTVQPYPDHPDRFDCYIQVLCRESVCGRCYWEIEWSGDVFISVSYKSISRKGSGFECLFGGNDQSWSLTCSSSSYSFIHNKINTKLPVKSISSRIGVYVDHSAGTLSFYSVSGDTMSLIHTVQTTFTQPLYPGFTVYRASSVKLVKLKTLSDECRKTWKSCIDTYRNERRKEADRKRSGAGVSSVRPWCYSGVMGFLNSFLEDIITASNVVGEALTPEEREGTIAGHSEAAQTTTHTHSQQCEVNQPIERPSTSSSQSSLQEQAGFSREKESTQQHRV